MPRRPLAIASLLVVALAGDASAAPKRRVIDRIVAVVDDACVTKSEVDRYVTPFEARLDHDYEGRPGERAAALLRLRQEAVRALIDSMLFAREAERIGLTVTPAEIDTALTSIAAQNKLTVAEILAAAKEQGSDEPRYREEIRAQLVEGKLVQLDAPKRYADWKTLSRDAQIERLSRSREALIGELREKAYIEVRL